MLCEPHWFGGSVDDLRRVRAAVAHPGPGQGVRRRRAPAAAPARGRRRPRSCCWPCSTRPTPAAPASSRGARASAWSRSSRPTTSASWTPRSRPAPGSSASTTATCGRSTSIPSAPSGCAPLVPDDRLVIAESGVRDAGHRRPLAGRWASMARSSARRSCAAADPTAAARVVRGRGPPARATRPTSPGAPFVKICGMTDAAGVLAAVRAGADAIGLNVVPGTPRALALDEAAALAAARARGGAGRAAATDRGDHRRRRAPTRSPRSIAAVDPDAIQDSGDGRRSRAGPAHAPRRAWKAVHVPRRRPTPPSATGPSRARGPCWPAVSSASSSTPPAARIRAAPGRARTPRWPRRSPGTCRSSWPVA